MIICDTTGPLPKGISHIMRVALLAPKFWDLDLTRKPILLLLPLSRGKSLIGVTTTLAISISPAAMPSTKELHRGGIIRGYTFLIRGVAGVEVCSSHRRSSSNTHGRAAPCQSTPSRVIPWSVMH